VGTFSEEMRESAEGIWQVIFRHPFLREIEDGTLPEEKFRYYLSQDYHYLDAFAKAVGLALAKASDASTLQLLAQRVIRPVEKPLHKKLLELLVVDPLSIERTLLAPTNLAYMNHLLVTAALGGMGEAAAALLPCPWTYHEIGKRLGEVEHPVYGEWAAFYASGFLTESVEAWRALVDRAGAQASPTEREAMQEAFLLSSRYEYLFWEMAYQMEGWPV